MTTEARHLGTERSPLCGRITGCEVIDNERPDCLACRVISAAAQGHTPDQIIEEFDELAAGDRGHVEKILRWGHPLTWPAWHMEPHLA